MGRAQDDTRRPDAPTKELVKHALALARFLNDHGYEERAVELRGEAAVLRHQQMAWEHEAGAARIVLYHSDDFRKRLKAAEQSSGSLLAALSDYAQSHPKFRPEVDALAARVMETPTVELLELLLRAFSKPPLRSEVPPAELVRAEERADRLRSAATGLDVADAFAREHIARAEEALQLRNRQFWKVASLDRIMCREAQELFGHDFKGSGLFVGYAPLGRPKYPLDPSVFVNAPTKLARTTNPQTCAAHIPPLAAVFGGELGCKATLDAGQIVLVWDWEPGVPPVGPGGTVPQVTQPDGYRIYASFNGQAPLLWGTQDTGVDWTTLGVPPPGVGTNVCYTVRAYQGMWESADSNRVCIGDFRPEPSTKRVVLDSDRMNSFVTSGSSPGYFRAVQTRVPRPPIDIVAGEALHFAYTRPFEVFGWYDWTFDSYRGAVHFDLTFLQGKAIDSATFTYDQTAIEDSSSDNVAFEWHICDSDWLSGPSIWPEPGEWIADLNGPPTPIDVTGVVRQWTTGRANLGFLLKSLLEGNPDDLVDRNWIHYYSNFKLEVHFYE
jgi:hypothetical protein